VHFVGIGGAGMSAIARILLARGVAVSGSDAKESGQLGAIRALGATVHVGHDAAHLADATTVVVSNAIKEDNPEVRRARELGLRVIPRAAALAAVMHGRRRVAVAGTAGKTSTSAMLTVAHRHAGADPAFAIGAAVHGIGANAHDGGDPLFVAEADESDSSFLLLSPDVAVVTNVGRDDHLDLHGTPENYARVFEEFTDRIAPGGVLVTNADDPGAVRLADRARREPRRRLRLRTFGTSPAANLRLADITIGPEGTTYRAMLDGAPLARVRLAVPGRHMALNSAAALLAAVETGLTPGSAIAGLAAYRGVARRFEYQGTAGGIRVYDDYAHNPTKVREQLRASVPVARPGRLIVVFQPPLFSSAKRFPAEFGAALGAADQVLVMDVSRAREQPIPGVTGELVARHVPLPSGDLAYCPGRPEVLAELARRARPGDLVLTVGTGDVTGVGPRFLAEVAARSEAGAVPVLGAVP
jgi:UDP-N-acetylmuramate--alanine ligase